MNKLFYIDSVDDFFQWWPFFLQGYRELMAPCSEKSKITEETFFKVLLHIAVGPRTRGALILLTTKSLTPLAFVALLENTTPFDEKSVCCYALYSNNKSPTAVGQLHTEVKAWCKAEGVRRILAASYRINGTAVRLFRKWGFQKECLIFSKTYE